MKPNRILINGGVATGAKAAARARGRNPHAKITEITILEGGPVRVAVPSVQLTGMTDAAKPPTN
jgi:hypothetical protein